MASFKLHYGRSNWMWICICYELISEKNVAPVKILKTIFLTERIAFGLRDNIISKQYCWLRLQAFKR